MVSIFPNLCLWRRSLRSNLGGIDLEKLYRATLKEGVRLIQVSLYVQVSRPVAFFFSKIQLSIFHRVFIHQNGMLCR